MNATYFDGVALPVAPRARMNLPRLKLLPALALATAVTMLTLLAFAWVTTSATPVYRTAPSPVQEAAARAASEEAFLANCLTNGAGTQFCGCMADGLQARLTTGQLAALNSSNATTREQPQVVNAVSQVTEGCTIPLQLSQAN